MRKTGTWFFGKNSIIFSFALLLFLSNNYVISQNMLPGRNDIYRLKISTIIANKVMIQNEKSKKLYTDTLKYNIYSNLIEKHISAFDTNAEREMAGVWTYKYDSLGNRSLETRKAPNHEVMDYFNYVYDSSRIKKQIWVYWVNMKLLFSRIYEVKYDGSGRLSVEMIEDGSEKLDSILAFKYDTNNRMTKRITASDKDFKDTINTVSYFYNANGTVAKTITASKTSKIVDEFTYDQNNKVIKHSIDDEVTTYMYNKDGLLTSSEVTEKAKKGLKYKYTYTYLYR